MVKYEVAYGTMENSRFPTSSDQGQKVALCGLLLGVKKCPLPAFSLPYFSFLKLFCALDTSYDIGPREEIKAFASLDRGA